jgi:RHS repeat-associated protein
MSKTVSGSTSQFLWDVASAIPLLLKDGSTAYVYGPGGLPVERINGSTLLWLHHDQLGSTRLVTDSSGSNQATYTYDAYGNLAASTGTVTNPLRFAGQYRDSESSLYYLRARYYDPSTGLFLRPDPAVATTREPYAYVMDNPLNGTDPSGQYDCGLQFWKCVHRPSSPQQAWNNFKGNVDQLANKNVYGGCVEGSAGFLVGGVASGCVAFNAHSFGVTGTLGYGIEFPGGASVGAGPLFGIGAHKVHDLGDVFTYAGASGGEGVVAGADFASGTGSCGQAVTTFVLSAGAGLNVPWPASVHAGSSFTWTWTPVQ